MKIKIDFVTNSSSTNFIVWGIETSVSTLLKYFKNVDKSDLNFRNDIIKHFSKYGLDIGMTSDSEVVYIGNSPFDMGENETLKSFKEGIVKRIGESGLDIRNKKLEAIFRVLWE